MSIQPDTDQQLAKTSGKLAANGAKLFGVAAVLVIAGVILLLLDLTIAGLFSIGLAGAPTIAAIALSGSGAVGKRAAERKDFA